MQRSPEYPSSPAPGVPGAEDVVANVSSVALKFAEDRAARLGRTGLERADFDALAAAGFTRAGVPVARGGLWADVAGSTRLCCDLVRTVARSDPSLALVLAMHPTVLCFWSMAPAPGSPAWRSQCDEVFGSAVAGHWWGTIASEPGSGGNILDTRAQAVPLPDVNTEPGIEPDPGADVPLAFALSGNKHMGSGSGMTSYMLTVAVPEGETSPDVFIIHTEGVPWDGTRGMTLTREWDGLGMAATQSHAFRFEAMPVQRYARPGEAIALVPHALGVIACVFCSVILGVLDAAMSTARERLAPRWGELGGFERAQWTTAENEVWLAEQAHRAMLDQVGDPARSRRASGHGKLAIARLAESALTRVCRVIGGASFSRGQPFGQWALDVRALGLLRPPWGLLYEQLFALSFEQAASEEVDSEEIDREAGTGPG